MRVLLLNMPFVSLTRPAIGISILKARLAQENIACRIGYANLFFAERVGLAAYGIINDRLSSSMFAGRLAILGVPVRRHEPVALHRHFTESTAG